MTTNCPSDETLAAFIDGRMSASAREDVVEHLSECGLCRDVVHSAVDFQAEPADQGDGEERVPEVARPAFGGRRIARAAALLAAAAALVVVFGGPLRERIFGGDGMSALVEASRAVSVRPGEGRLSADFDYKQPKPRFRGGESEETELWRVMAEAAELEQARRPDLHALAVAHLYLGREDEAIEGLRRAMQEAGNAEKRNAIANDLAAALIARRATGDAEAALALAEGAWRTAKTPAVAWNRAAALQALDRDADAIRAWNEYLQLDPSSPWAAEAKRNRDSLAQG